MVKQAVEAKDDIFFTRTMADVLEKQGRHEDALAIYKILLDSNPADESLKAKIDGLNTLARGRAKGQGS
ncbi:MAG: hypothetical protein OEV59_06735 [Deltaproteobacteria bacterium]|nr:hypothetical protein [Deltaproteobacteria bacterium]